jgi:WD40 repeat protein
VRVFRTSDWAEERALGHGDLVYWVAFHPADGRRLVTGSIDGLTVWDPSSGEKVGVAGDFRERSVIRGAFSPDGTRLAVIAWDHSASIVSTDRWQEIRKLKGVGRPRGVCWSTDGEVLVTVDEATGVHLWYPGDRPHLPVLAGHGDRVTSAAFHKDGRRALTSCLDGSARIFETERGRLLHALPHGRSLSAARFGPGERVVTVGEGRVAVWNAETGARVRELERPEAKAVDAFPLGGGRVFVTYADGGSRLWSGDSGEVVRDFEGHRGPVVCAAFHEGRGLAATGGSDRTARVLDLATGRTVATCAFPSIPLREQPPGVDLARVYALVFDRSGDRLVGGCQDLRLRVWNARTGALEREERAATPGMLALSPDGRWLMIGAKWLGRVSFLDLSDASTSLRPAPFHDSHMTAAIRFSPDGRLALVASKDGAIKVWTMDPIGPESVFDARCGVLLDAAFSPDGRRLIVAGSNGTARIWAMDPLEVAERHCPISDPVWETLQSTLEQSMFTR